MDTPPCRICGKTDAVGCYREEAPEQTICMNCCEGAEHHDGETGHVFYYEPGEGHMCNYCGVPRSATNYDDDNDYGYDEDIARSAVL